MKWSATPALLILHAWQHLLSRETQAARDMSWRYASCAVLETNLACDIQGQNIAYVMDNEMYNDVLAYTRASESVILL